MVIGLMRLAAAGKVFFWLHGMIRKGIESVWHVKL
jgi:hypothetical protein